MAIERREDQRRAVARLVEDAGAVVQKQLDKLQVAVGARLPSSL